MKTIPVITFNKIDKLSNLFDLIHPVMKHSFQKNNNNNKIIEEVNYFDCKLYDLYNKKY